MQFDPPSKFLQNKGEPLIPWSRWKEEYLTYLKAIDGERLSAERKKNIFLHCLGSEGQVVFRTMPPVRSGGDYNVFDEAVQRIEARFKPTTSVALNRFKFYTRCQEEGECFDDFLTALRALSVHCNFGMMKDEMIRDQIIVHVKSKKTQEQLWILGDPSLEIAISTAKAIEQSDKWIKSLNKNVKLANTSEVNAVINSGSTKNVQNTANKDNTTIHNTRGKTYYCYRCGNPGHIASFPRCSAIGKEGIKCGRTGHYSKMCRDNQPRRFTSYSAQSFPTKGKVSTISNHSPQRENTETDIESGIVVSIQDCYNIEEVDKIDPPRCNVTILGKDLQLLADSGSPWTVITKQYCLEMLGEVIDCDALCKPDITAQNFDGSCIDFLGFQEVPITFQQSKAFIKLYVAVKGVNVLGWRDQAKLGIVLNPRKREPVMVIAVTTDFAEQFVGLFPDVFTEKLGKLKGFSHRIKVKDGSIPVKQKLRGVPLSIRNELKFMLDELVKAEVIQEVESSEWVSPIVLTQKLTKVLGYVWT